MTINLVVFQPYVTKVNTTTETLQHIFTFIFKISAISGMNLRVEGLAGDRIGGEKPGFLRDFP